jgi:hypothetical protein
VTYRFLSLGLLSVGLLKAQDAPAPASLSKLSEVAEQKTVAWEALAKSLEPKIAILLPCDAGVLQTVSEVSAASEARLSAYAAYFAAAVAEAATINTTAHSLADRNNKNIIGGDFLDTERAETGEQRASVEPQLAQLSADVARRPELAQAEATLRAIAALIDQRNVLINRQSAVKDSRLDALREVASLTQARLDAMNELVAAQEAEGIRWRAYYAARIDRAKAECAAISPAPPKPRAKLEKQ